MNKDSFYKAPNSYRQMNASDRESFRSSFTMNSGSTKKKLNSILYESDIHNSFLKVCFSGTIDEVKVKLRELEQETHEDE